MSEERTAILAHFARTMIRAAWAGAGHGDEIQDLAERLGLIVSVPGGYNPAVHGESEYGACPGDEWFTFAPWLDTDNSPT